MESRSRIIQSSKLSVFVIRAFVYILIATNKVLTVMQMVRVMILYFCNE